MALESTRCESCGMPVHSYRYCALCTDEDGNLQSFDVRLESMIADSGYEYSHLNYEQARERAKQLMAEMPAWRDHPRIVGLRRSDSEAPRHNDAVGQRHNDPVE